MQRHIAKRVKRNSYFLVKLRWQALYVEALANVMVSSWHVYLSQLCDAYVCCWPHAAPSFHNLSAEQLLLQYRRILIKRFRSS